MGSDSEKTHQKSGKMMEHKIPKNRILEFTTTQGWHIKTILESIKDQIPEAPASFSTRKKNSKKKDTESTEESAKKKPVKKGKKESLEIDEDEIEQGIMKISATNGAGTVMVIATFDTWEIAYCPKRIKIGLDINFLYKYIKNITDKDTLTFFIDKGSEDRLGITINRKNQQNKNDSSLQLLELQDKIFDTPKVNFDTFVLIPSKSLQNICKIMCSQDKNDKIDIIYNGGQLEFRCKNEAGTQSEKLCSIKKETDPDDSEDVDDGEIIQGTYELKNLLLFTKCTPTSDMVELYMKNDEALYVIYKIASLGKVVWITALTH